MSETNNRTVLLYFIVKQGMEKLPRVVIIDDEKDTVEVFSELLGMKGVKVVGTGHDGYEAVEIYKNIQPDILLTDISMPDFDGLYAIEKIKEFDPNARIIVISGSLSDEYRKKIEPMVSGIIRKPCDADQVVKIIKEQQEKEILITS